MNKKISNLILILFIILSGVFAYLWWQERKKDGSSFSFNGKSVSPDTVRIAAQKWFSIEDSYNEHLKNRKAISDQRWLLNPQADTTIPIDTRIGDVYMASYRKSLTSPAGEDNTKAIFVARQELEYYIGYMDITHIDTMQFSLGRFDSVALSLAGLRDSQLEENMHKNGKYTLIGGLPKSPRPPANSTNYTNAFSIEGTTFYEDWHDSWP